MALTRPETVPADCFARVNAEELRDDVGARAFLLRYKSTGDCFARVNAEELRDDVGVRAFLLRYKNTGDCFARVNAEELCDDVGKIWTRKGTSVTFCA